MNGTDSSEAKKAYSTPSLQTYGDIRVLTQAVNPTGMGDGGMAGATKT